MSSARRAQRIARPCLLTCALLLAFALAACEDDVTTSTDVGDTAADVAGDGFGDAGTDTVGPDVADTWSPDVAVDTTSPDTATTDTAGDDGADGDVQNLDPCGRPMPAADRTRKVVVGMPYVDSTQGTPYAVLDLSPTGELTPTATTFLANRQPFGTIPFTPNGRIGFTVDNNGGNIAVFRFEDDGSVTVVTTDYQDGFYADTVVVDASGEFIYVLDSNWRENGGGIFRVDLACDGTLSNARRVVPSKLARAMVAMPGQPGRFFVGAADVMTSNAAHNAHVVDLATPAYLGGADAFAASEHSVSAGAVTADGRFGLLADNSAFSGIPNRVGAVSLQGGALAPAGILGPFVDPAGIATSPYNNAALVAAAQEDAIYVLSYDPTNATSPFTVRGELATQSASLLPVGLVSITRGSLNGVVLVGENTAVRRVRFEPDGGVTDLGATELGEALGALGVQP